MSPIESGILAGWAMLNLIVLVTAIATSLRVNWFEGVLTSSHKLASLRRDRATAITVLWILVMMDILMWLNNPSIPAANF